MNKKIAVWITALVLAAPVTHAMSLGAFGSYWNQKDGDGVSGAGVDLLFDFLPLELRGTYYEETSAPDTGSLQIIPIDFGVALGLTRAQVLHVLAVAGGSYFILDADHGEPDNEFGWYAGGRLEFPLDGGMSVFGELLYRGADMDNVDANFSGTTINLGVIF